GDEYTSYRAAQSSNLPQLAVPTLLSTEYPDGLHYWMHDAFGRMRVLPPWPSVANELAAAVGAALAETVPVSVAAPLPQGSKEQPGMAPIDPFGPPTADRIAQIRTLDDYLLSVSSQRLNLDKLSTQVPLLSISPAWPAVDA